MNEMKDFKEEVWEMTADSAVVAIEEQARRFYSEGRLDRAAQLLETLIKMRPDAGRYHALLGVIYRRQKRLVQALQCLQRACEIDASDRNALVNLGESLILVGKVEEGSDMLMAVVKMGYEKGKPVCEQDMFTKRAGVQLAMLEKIARVVKEEAEKEEGKLRD